MNPAQKIIKNSIWLIVQPLILNVISLFVIGYIARTLGEADYGKFIFAFAFVAMFYPFANFGLHQVTVRAIAQDKTNAGIFIGKIVILRFLLSLLTMAAIAIVINAMGYPPMTKTVVYLASSTVVFYTVASTLQDVFQAFEGMHYIAYVEFISGFVLTALSVVVLYMGYHLTGITAVYCAGSLLGMLATIWFLCRNFTAPVFKIDLLFWKQSLAKGVPFFFPGLLVMFGSKIGIVLLSKMAGDASVGVYGAANSLIEKFLIIPDSVCTALFPALAALHQTSKEDAKYLFERFFLYLFLTGIFAAASITVFAKPIIGLIYGVQYASSIVPLQLMSWWLFLSFLTYIQSWTLAAIHQEKKGAIARFITVPCFIMLSIALIPHLKEKGVILSSVAISLIHFMILHRFLKIYLVNIFEDKKTLLKVACIAAIVSCAAFFFNKVNFFAAALIAPVLYILLLLKWRIMKVTDFLYLKSFLKK